MRPITLCLGLALLVASRALAGPTLLIPDFSDPDNPVEGVRARAEILKALGAYQDIRIAPLSKLKRLAPRHHLNPKELGSSEAASVLGRYEAIDGVLAGTAGDRDELRILRLELYDPSGASAFSAEITLSGGTISAQSAAEAARGIARALGASATPPPPPAQSEPPPPAFGEEPGAAPAAPGGAKAPGAAGPDGRYPTGATMPPPSEAPPKAGEPLFEVGLFLPLSLRDFSLTDPSLTPPTFLTYDTNSPYTGVAADFALFPLAHMAYGLQGIGLLGSFSIGLINNSYTNAEGTVTAFKSQDLRVGGDLTYRLHLTAIEDSPGVASAYNPSFGLRVGFSYFDYVVNANPVDLQNIVRTPLDIGLDYLQPFGSWLRLGLGGEVLLLASPGSAEENEYGSASSLGWGVYFSAGGLFGLAGLGYLVKLDYLDFNDQYKATPSTLVQGVASGTETYLDIWIGLTYAIE